MSWAYWLPKSRTTTVSGSDALPSPRGTPAPGTSRSGRSGRGRVEGDLEVGLDLGVVGRQDAVAGVGELAVDGLAALARRVLVVVGGRAGRRVARSRARGGAPRAHARIAAARCLILRLAHPPPPRIAAVRGSLPAGRARRGARAPGSGTGAGGRRAGARRHRAARAEGAVRPVTGTGVGRTIRACGGARSAVSGGLRCTHSCRVGGRTVDDGWPPRGRWPWRPLSRSAASPLPPRSSRSPTTTTLEVSATSLQTHHPLTLTATVAPAPSDTAGRGGVQGPLQRRGDRARHGRHRRRACHARSPVAAGRARTRSRPSTSATARTRTRPASPSRSS